MSVESFLVSVRKWAVAGIGHRKRGTGVEAYVGPDPQHSVESKIADKKIEKGHPDHFSGRSKRGPRTIFGPYKVHFLAIVVICLVLLV